MTDLSNSELRRIDLTLLLVFLGLLRHRKANIVAAELGLTQSAISQCVKRLREIFGDALFLRRPHGMEPTATALALEERIARAVETLRSALGAARAFDPALSSGIVRIAALDAEQAVLVPPLSADIRVAAPGLRLAVLPLGRGDAIEALADGRVDLALGFLWDVPGHVSAEALYSESYLVAGSPAVLPGAPSLSLDEYCAADHVLITPGGDLRGVIDDRLEALGRSRSIVLGLPAFLPALAAVATSRAIVTLPSRIARGFAKGFGLAVADPPVDVRTFTVSVYWHRRNDADPRTLWLRSRLQACVSKLA